MPRHEWFKRFPICPECHHAVKGKGVWFAFQTYHKRCLESFTFTRGGIRLYKQKKILSPHPSGVGFPI